MNDSTVPPLSAIVLAAGEGSRMRSERPKPLHRLCGRPMLTYVLEALGTSGVGRAVIVVGHKGDWVTKTMQEQTHDLTVDFAQWTPAAPTALAGWLTTPSGERRDLTWRTRIASPQSAQTTDMATSGPIVGMGPMPANAVG